MADKSVRVNKILPFPKRLIADPNICEKIDGLWEYDKKFLILSGPPGVGKTHTAEDYIYKKVEKLSSHITIDATRLSTLFPDFRTKVYSSEEIRKVLQELNVKFVWDLVVLHPQYSYEDLIRGYKVFPLENSSTLKVREGVLGFISRVVSELEQLEGAQKDPQGVLILDEINRAPIGQLFGEAIYALDRRGEKTTTPYELENYGNSISIPKSIMLLGTMNSIDRAISGFDYALRRRFSSITISSSEKAVEESWKDLESEVSNIGPKLYEILKTLIMTSDQIGTIPKKELVLGHAYFIPPHKHKSNSSNVIKWIVFSYLYQIIPTLVDYIEQGILEYAPEQLSKIPMGDIISGTTDLYNVDESQIEADFIKFFNDQP